MRLHLSTAIRALAGASALVLALPAAAQVATAAPQDEDEILVTAQRLNETGVEFGGSLGVLGDKSAEDVPFSIRSYARVRRQRAAASPPPASPPPAGDAAR